ncbi:MAG TPA: hypothetical protein EYP39_04770 [Ghiorsea sp.]|nr:hypothetical protein [Ghiorsea sp.]
MRRFFVIIALLILPWFNHSIAAEPSVERLMLLHELDGVATDKSQTVAMNTPNNTKPFRVLIDVRSDHSDGAHDFKTLTKLAKQRHIDALTFTEHDRFTIRLGLEPVPWLIGYSQEHPSLYATGLNAFFHDLNVAQQQTDITIMAGTESTPGYYWQGIPFKDLSLHDAEKHLITLGVQNAAQIEALTSYNLTHAYGNKGLSLVFWFVFIFILLRVLVRKQKRGVALLLIGSFIAFLSTWLITPAINTDNAFIQSAKSQNLFVIWTHPGTLSGVREGSMGVQLNTPPYNEHIFEHPTDAFAAVYGDTDNNTVAGGLWDRFMMGYLQGYIAKPMWAVAAGDYHEEGQANEYLGNFPMDVWAASNREVDILAALKQGRMTAWHMYQQQNLSVHTLSLTSFDPVNKQAVQLFTGDEAAITSEVRLNIGIEERGADKSITSLSGQWIVDGRIHEKVLVPISASKIMTTTLHLPKGKHVIRFQIPPQQGIRLETNPFLVDVR